MRHAFGRTALMLSGAGMHGAFHLGVIKGLLNHDQLPRVVAGSSVGAIVSCCYLVANCFVAGLGLHYSVVGTLTHFAWIRGLSSLFEDKKLCTLALASLIFFVSNRIKHCHSLSTLLMFDD